MSHSISAVENFMWVDDCQSNYVVFLFPFSFVSSFFLLVWNSSQDYNGFECLMVCFTWSISCTLKLNVECPRNIVCFWSSNINNNQPKCDGLFGFTMHRPFHLCFFFLIPASGTSDARVDRPNSVRSLVSYSFSFLLFSSKAQLLICFIRKTSNRNSAIHLNPTINVYAFDGDLINFSMWTMRTTQSRLCQFHVHIIFRIDAWNKNDFST